MRTTTAISMSRPWPFFEFWRRDVDSFTKAERVQYAYLRGMTDYRLASDSTAGAGVSDPKKAFRDHARHWLALSAAMEKKTPGSLNTEEKERLDKTLEELNHEVFGGAEAPTEGGDPNDEATNETWGPTSECKADADCSGGEACRDGKCASPNWKPSGESGPGDGTIKVAPSKPDAPGSGI